MRRRYMYLGFFVLLLGTLLACGYFINRRAAAPMAQQQDQVAISLSALPESLFDAELLASGSNPIVCLDSALYEVQSNAYRRMELPLEHAVTPNLITPAPDGGLWMVLECPREGCYLLKTSAQGTIVVQHQLQQSDVNSMVCDSIGRVYLIVDHCTQVQRYSPEGELQNTTELDTRFKTASLVVQNDRVFAACFEMKGKRPQRAEYVEIYEDFTCGEGFPGCIKMDTSNEICAIGSFLPEYILMEYDDVGLYACRENGTWETVCCWSDQHLDGTVAGRLIRDAQGRGVIMYEKNGTRYTMTLSNAKK